MTAYLAAYDRDDNGAFNGDLTPDLLDMQWRLGMAEPFDTIAPPAEARLTVRNPDGRYSPGHPASSLPAGLALRIQSDDGDTHRTHFFGTVARVEPAPGEYGPRTAVIVAVGPMTPLMENAVRLPVMQDVCAGDVVHAVIDRVPGRLRYLDGAFVVGTSGRAELGTQTRLPAADAFHPRTFEHGTSRFAFVGDNWEDGIPAIDAIREVVEAERGRFYVDRSGAFVLLNRHSLLTRGAASAAFTDSMHGIDVSYGADTVSRVTVRLYPRQTTGAADVLWRLGEAKRVRAGEGMSFLARFRGENGEKAGALHVMTPRPHQDYTANSAANGTGTDLTDRVEFRLLGWDGAAADVLLLNIGTSDAYLLPGSVIRGHALLMADPMTVEQRSATAQTFFGPRALRLNLPGLTRVDDAENIARYELARRSQPRTTARAVTLAGQAHRPHILARTLFDRVTLTESQSGHQSDAFIVGEAHHVTAGGAQHRVTWTLEPVNPAQFWQLGAGALDTGTRLAY